MLSKFIKTTSRRQFSTLVLAEHFEGKLNHSVGSCLTAASQFSDPTVDVLVHGSSTSVANQVSELSKYPGINKIIAATHDSLDNPYGQTMASITSSLVKANNYT